MSLEKTSDQTKLLRPSRDWIKATAAEKAISLPVIKGQTYGAEHVHCESKKTVPLFTAYNFRNIEQIFTKFGTNQSLFILNIVPEFI